MSDKSVDIWKQKDGSFRFECPFCRFARTWATEPGVLTGVAEHLRTHKKRLVA